MSNVDKTSSCWLWTASVFLNSGRARGFIGQRSTCASRISYVLFKGKVKDKLVCHKCDNPLCVKPSHLFLGTPKDNMQDMIRKGRKFLTQGETNGSSKLTDKQVINIRRLAKSGISNRSIAAKYQVCPSNIGMIVKRITWRHIK